MPAPDSRTLRIFISSTFRDMHAERERLVKRVFPELRRLCAERFVTFTEVDLRWGVTEEQAAEGQVLPICLDEIERSRPFFVGLLGERYGWIAEDIAAEVIAREPSMHGRAYFYFRDPEYLDRLPAGSDRADFESESPEAREKLERLRARNCEARDRGVCQVREAYPNPDALADAVRADLIELIDWRYPKEAVPDPLDQEAQGHGAYGQSKRFAYVERPAHASALDAAVAGDGPPLVVTGESGGGKTALLASWAARWAERHPGDVVFEHYFGATPQSASVSGFLQRLLGELKRRYDIGEEIPAQPDKLREALPLWLAQTVDRGRIVLVFDGLNQIDGNEPDRRLAFVPHHVPPNVRVVASALPGPALDALRERGWTEHALPLPNAEERDRMIGEFLDTYRKTLGPDLRRQLVVAPGASNPLFLRTVLEELRQFGSFEALPARVEHYLEADTPEELFRRVLRRWQEDFDAGQDLVLHAATFLWAARQGLAEAEWLELLGSAGQPLARRVWRPLFLAMEPHLAQRAGLHAFGHDFLRRAVEREFLPDPEEQRAAHLALANYFEAQPETPPRKAAEWPWQLTEAAAWDRLHAALVTRSQFLALYTPQTKWDLTGYWIRLTAARPDMSMGATYPSAYETWMRETPDRASFAAGQLASFLIENGAYVQAEPLNRRALEGYERVLGADHPETLTSVNNLAVVLMRQGDYAQAEPLYRRALEGRERVLGAAHPDTLSSVSHLASLLRRQGDYAQAEPLYRRALEGSERVLGTAHPDTLLSVNNLAVVLARQGDYAQAEALYRRALEGRERVLGAAHPETLLTLTSVNNLALCLQARGELAGAEPLYRRAMEGWERALRPAHPNTLTAVNNLATCIQARGDLTGAEPLLRRALEGRERVLGAAHPDVTLALNLLAMLLRKLGRAAASEPYLRQAIAIERQALPPASPKHANRLNNLCTVLVMQRKLTEARPLLAEAWSLKENSHDITSARILFVRLAIALLDAEPVSPYLGQLKTLLAGEALETAGGVTTKWGIESFVASLQPDLLPADAALLEALATALNDHAKVADLDRYPAWSRQPLLPLDTKWANA